MNIQRLKRPLQEDQYYKVAFLKKYIFLHHTAGASAQSAIEWWNSKPDRIATPFIIDRDGTIYENFEPKYWSYALGVKGGTYIEKASIHIEIVSFGKIEKEGDEYYFQLSQKTSRTKVPGSDIITFDESYRDCFFYQKYTDAQVASILSLVPELIKEFPSIQIQPSIKGFWELQNKNANLPSGLWSHTSVRKDKSDIFPQPNLIEGLYSLYPHS